MTATRIESAVMDSPWSPEARAALGRLPFHERATTEQQIAEICAGKCAKLVVDGKLVGFLGYEIQGNAFFITALVALSENTALVATCREAIEAKARAIGCAFVGFWTPHPALIEKLRLDGYAVTRAEMVKKL